MEIERIGAAGMLAASQAVNVHANNIVNAQTPDFKAQRPVFSPIVNGGAVAVFTQNTEQPVNLIGETVGLIQASNQYKAAAKLVKTGEEMSSFFLQTIA
jgi:flagellar hook protein FlgE